MDRLTLEDGSSVWVEKTPWHLYCIDEIQRRIPDAIIIHVVRGGADVVASLIKATKENPAEWGALGRGVGSRGYTIDKAVERWNKDISISNRYVGKEGSIIIRYEIF